MDLFSFLDGISPLWWVAFALALGVAEMATMSFFLIWPAGAAVAMAAALWAMPGLSGTAQVVAFAVLSIAATVAGRAAMRRWGDGGAVTPGLNDRAALTVGRTGRVTAIDGDEGHVEVDGLRWRARWAGAGAPAPGDRIRVTGTEGGVLLVEPA